jgi:hypothetical protein
LRGLSDMALISSHMKPEAQKSNPWGCRAIATRMFQL